MGSCRSISGYLVVFDLLSGPDQSRIANRRGLSIADDVLAFFDQAGHGVTFFAAALLAQGIEYLLEPPHLGLGLFKMVLEGHSQIVRGSRLGHLRQRLRKLPLRVIEIPNLSQI